MAELNVAQRYSKAFAAVQELSIRLREAEKPFDVALDRIKGDLVIARAELYEAHGNLRKWADTQGFRPELAMVEVDDDDADDPRLVEMLVHVISVDPHGVQQ